jgi:CcmD family protein
VSSGDRYVFAAYTVVLVTVLAYLLIIALKVSRLDRELGDLARRARERRATEEEQDDREEAAVG